MLKRIVIAASAYLVPSFLLGFFWHLVWFKRYYDALAIYRHDVIIPFGLLSMSIQALLFAWIYLHSFASRRTPLVRRTLAYSLFGAALSWSFTTIAVAAKNVMASVGGYVLVESGFTVVQWLLVGPITALAVVDGFGPIKTSLE
jgi:hypothetical protein